MPESLSDKIIQKIDHVAELYHRLILVIAPAGGGKTAALQEIHQRTGAPLINVNLELSRRLLDLTERQRILQLSRLFSEIIESFPADLILLDNLEMLFDVLLMQDPLRLLQGLSRNKTIIASWSGSVEKGYLTYAAPDHPEYRRYSIKDLLIISPGEEE